MSTSLPPRGTVDPRIPHRPAPVPGPDERIGDNRYRPGKRWEEECEREDRGKTGRDMVGGADNRPHDFIAADIPDRTITIRLQKLLKIPQRLFMIFVLYDTMKIDTDDVKCIKETALTIRGSRRRTTVPSELIDILKLEDGDRIRWIVLKDGTTYVQKVKD